MSASKPAVPEPTRIGKYEIVAKLGAGAFGTVYKAMDPELGRLVAIKTIRLEGLAASQASLDDLLARFRREAQVAAKVKHPNIVTIYEFAGKAEGVSYISMEFVEGVGLDRVIAKSGRMSIERAAAIGAQVADALDYAWRMQKLVHRDIKPANIMIEPGDRVKVTDFGIAKVTDSADHLTATGSLLGTPSYMSPEQARGSAVDGRSDLFSVGCILYEMLAGQKAFRGESMTAIMFKIITEEPPSLRDSRPDGHRRDAPHHRQGALEGAGDALPERPRAGRRPPRPDPAGLRADAAAPRRRRPCRPTPRPATCRRSRLRPPRGRRPRCPRPPPLSSRALRRRPEGHRPCPRRSSRPRRAREPPPVAAKAASPRTPAPPVAGPARRQGRRSRPDRRPRRRRRPGPGRDRRRRVVPVRAEDGRRPRLPRRPRRPSRRRPRPRRRRLPKRRPSRPRRRRRRERPSPRPRPPRAPRPWRPPPPLAPGRARARPRGRPRPWRPGLRRRHPPAQARRRHRRATTPTWTTCPRRRPTGAPPARRSPRSTAPGGPRATPPAQFARRPARAPRRHHGRAAGHRDAPLPPLGPGGLPPEERALREPPRARPTRGSSSSTCPSTPTGSVAPGTASASARRGRLPRGGDAPGPDRARVPRRRQRLRAPAATTSRASVPRGTGLRQVGATASRISCACRRSAGVKSGPASRAVSPFRLIWATPIGCPRTTSGVESSSSGWAPACRAA